MAEIQGQNQENLVNVEQKQNIEQINTQELFNSIKENEFVGADIFINQFFDKLSNDEKQDFYSKKLNK